MELSHAAKLQDNTGWDNMMWFWIPRHWNQQKSDYLKEGTYRKTGTNWEISFIEKLLQILHNHCMYSNGVVYYRG